MTRVTNDDVLSAIVNGASTLDEIAEQVGCPADDWALSQSLAQLGLQGRVTGSPRTGCRYQLAA